MSKTCAFTDSFCVTARVPFEFGAARARMTAAAESESDPTTHRSVKHRPVLIYGAALVATLFAFGAALVIQTWRREQIEVRNKLASTAEDGERDVRRYFATLATSMSVR